MKKLLSVLLFLLVPILAWSAPFLVCDPQAGVTKYRINIPSAGITNQESAATVNGAARHDIGGWPVGTYNDATIEAGGEYQLNGQPQAVWRWSSPNPFDITVPAGGEPQNLGLNP